jgi:hypothetical protein
MAGKYLGEELVNIDHTEYRHWTMIGWSKFWIETYGQYDGARHKASTLDEVMQILHGTPIIIKIARWSSGKEEYRFSLGEKSKTYLKFVKDYEEFGDSWDSGIPA